ncbi:hypothetical protein ACQPZF_31270 [Actinosynnema sp. CS-041913]|uniref:hypothetical protein n=1 Tax=Actinosynnema sp. CS-041913 TaxID=3239917 RepID=UPI003D8D76BD
MSRRTAGVVLAVAAAVAAIAATFLPLSWVGTGQGQVRFGFTTTSWTTVVEPVELGEFRATPQVGVPIVVAAVVLLIAAALVFLPAHQRQASRRTAIAATGVLVGSVWATFMTVQASLELFTRDGRASIDREYGAGLWLLVAAVAVAVVGTVFLHAEPPPPRPEGVVVHRLDDKDADLDTPPLGIQVAVLPDDHPEPPAGPEVRTR